MTSSSDLEQNFLEQHVTAADSQQDLAREIDALSLTQALLDFEMANARVLDLTARLVEANARVIKLQRATDGHHGEIESLHGDVRLANVERDTLAANVEAERMAMRDSIANAEQRASNAEQRASNAEQRASNATAELAATHASKVFRVARLVKRITRR
jgi:chromosome segregation ATPase